MRPQSNQEVLPKEWSHKFALALAAIQAESILSGAEATSMDQIEAVRASSQKNPQELN
jgi:ABC-type amino acid transport system permease subunit